MSVLDELITNRQNGSFYNYTDLNRVGEAVELVAAFISEYGYVTSAEAKTDWAMSDIFYDTDGKYLLALLEKIKNNFGSVQVGELPETMEYLDYAGANEIERFLLDVYALCEEQAKDRRECGTFECEEAG